MFKKLNEFFANLKVRWSNWQAERIMTVEEAKANPERFVRQLIMYAENSYPWFQDPQDRFVYESYYDKHILCRLLIMGKVFGCEVSHMHYELQLIDAETCEIIACDLAWQCSVTSDYRGEQHDGNMKVRDLYRLVEDKHK